MSCDVYDRWKCHKKKLLLGDHVNCHLQNAWNKDGPEAFSFSVLILESDRSLLPGLERKFMVLYDSFNRTKGYNLDGATESKYIMGEETKAKIGAANRGRVRTPDMKAHMSQVKLGQGRGRVKSPQEIEKLKKAWLTRAPCPPVSQETKEKLRKAALADWAKRKAREEGV